MAHPMLHYSIGLAAGTLIMLPPVLRSMTNGRGISRSTGNWLLAAHLCGVWAILPNILRAIGLHGSFTNGWWMNVFFLNPLVDHLKPGGMLAGGSLIFICVTLQYVILLESILIVKKGGSPVSAP